MAAGQCDNGNKRYVTNKLWCDRKKETVYVMKRTGGNASYEDEAQSQQRKVPGTEVESIRLNLYTSRNFVA